MARFKAEVVDKEIARLKDKLESSRHRERESFEKEVNHAYRRGKREVVEVMKKRRDKFSQKFGEFKEHYKALADYRECRGTVGGLYLTQLPDYLYDGEYARQTMRLAEKDKNFAISEIEEKIWEQWDLVSVSPDTVEAETGDLGETGEVNQPVAPLDVNDYLNRKVDEWELRPWRLIVRFAVSRSGECSIDFLICFCYLFACWPSMAVLLFFFYVMGLAMCGFESLAFVFGPCFYKKGGF
ncbi:BnaCnng49260D [Brassica napus]|uniref:BnaCnng49260D protein n=2 Tax=Brassica TaxID=3705 RepID=A0A078JJM0_BRANA|nr:hypothetical protein Bca52824_053998 [Brassica carinata]CDY65996.1 BnaCnng49260D [Brassica napus]